MSKLTDSKTILAGEKSGRLSGIMRRIREAMQPPPILTVGAWADEYRVLSAEASAFPGRWDSEAAPHTIAPMDALSSSSPWEEVTLKWSSQSGKTEVLLNFAGYIMSHDPGPMLMIQPNLKPMGEAFSKDRIAPMIRDTPILSALFGNIKARDSGSTILHKTFPGGHATIGGSNSPAGLASRPIRYLLCDEIDRWEVTQEGHALPLARKRTQTFPNKKILKVSSPTFTGVGISVEYESADCQMEWHLICSDCGGHQMPLLKDFRWPGGIEFIIYICRHCGVEHPARRQRELKKHGVWVAVKNEPGNKIGYWINQWGSQLASWEGTAEEFLSAGKDAEKLQVVVNTAFAEPWEQVGDQADADALILRRESYIGMPEGAIVLTMGVDIQKDRIEFEVVGWARNYESWSVDYQILPGATDQPEVWSDLFDAIKARYTTHKGIECAIVGVCVDEGYQTQEVRDFVARSSLAWVFASKGADGEKRPIIQSNRDRALRLRKRQRGAVRPELIGTHQAKLKITTLLSVEAIGPGYCHFPMERDEEYFAQMASEKIITRYKKGFPIREWIKIRPRNEVFDCRVMAYAALQLVIPTTDARDVERFWTIHVRKVETGVKKKPAKRKKTPQSDPRRHESPFGPDRGFD